MVDDMKKKLPSFYRILLAAVLINLVSGINNTWSTFESALVRELGWSHVLASLPCSIYLGVYALAMILAGVMQDRIGARKTAVLAAAFYAMGLWGAASQDRPYPFALTYGVFVGCAVAFAYSSSLAAPLKYCVPRHRGRVSGLIMCSFGLTAAYMAPLSNCLIRLVGIRGAMAALGVLIVPLVFLSALALQSRETLEIEELSVVPAAEENTDQCYEKVSNVLRSPVFLKLFLCYFSSSLSGLILLSHITNIAALQAGIFDGYYLISVISVSNCLSRIVSGALSDHIPHRIYLTGLYLLSAVNMLLFPLYNRRGLLIVGCIFGGASFGAGMSAAPSLVSAAFGMSHFGRNFGFLAMASGLAGVVGPLLAGVSADFLQSYTAVLLLSGAIHFCSSVLCFRSFAPKL